MRIYVIYNDQTGIIVHVHRVAAETEDSFEDVRRLLPDSLKHAQLGVIEIDSKEMRAGEAYCIDPKNKKLQVAKSDGIQSSAVAREARIATRGNIS